MWGVALVSLAAGFVLGVTATVTLALAMSASDEPARVPRRIGAGVRRGSRFAELRG